MIEYPEGHEPEFVDDAPLAEDGEMHTCTNCGAETNLVVRSGKKKGFCPVCKETA